MLQKGKEAWHPFPRMKIINLWVVGLVKPIENFDITQWTTLCKVNCVHQIDISFQSKHEVSTTPSFCEGECQWKEFQCKRIERCIWGLIGLFFSIWKRGLLVFRKADVRITARQVGKLILSRCYEKGQVNLSIWEVFFSKTNWTKRRTRDKICWQKIFNKWPNFKGIVTNK